MALNNKNTNIPAEENIIDHNLYDLLGDILMGSMQDKKFDQSKAENYLKLLLRVGLNVDLGDEYGVTLDTGPSTISPGTRDYNIKLTKDF